MTHIRFLELLQARHQGWEVEITGLDHSTEWHRFRVSPFKGYFERYHIGEWFPCPLGTAGHTDWRLADMGQPRRNA